MSKISFPPIFLYLVPRQLEKEDPYSWLCWCNNLIKNNFWHKYLILIFFYCNSVDYYGFLTECGKYLFLIIFTIPDTDSKKQIHTYVVLTESYFSSIIKAVISSPSGNSVHLSWIQTAVIENISYLVLLRLCILW